MQDDLGKGSRLVNHVYHGYSGYETEGWVNVVNHHIWQVVENRQSCLPEIVVLSQVWKDPVLLFA